MGIFDIFTAPKRIRELEAKITELSTPVIKAETFAPSKHWDSDSSVAYREDMQRPVNAEDYLMLYEMHAPTYSCVDAIARNCAKIPMKIYNDAAIKGGKKKHEAEVTEGSTGLDLQVWQMLNMPNPEMSLYDLRYATVAFAELAGIAYWEKGSRTKNYEMPDQLWPLRPDWMRAMPAEIGKGMIGKYNYVCGNGNIVEYDPNEIFYYKYWHPRSDFYGNSPVKPAQNGIIIDLYCIKYAKQFFKNGGHIEKYISVKEKLKDTEFNRLAQQMQTYDAGLEHAFKMKLMDGGGEIRTVGGDPDKVSLNKTRQAALDEACMAWGVPPLILGLPNSTHYNNADAQYKVFYQETVQPKNYNYESAVNRNILRRLGYHAEMDYSAIDVLQPNLEKRANTSFKLVQGRIMTPNEIRQEFWDKDPLPGGDEFPSVETASQLGTSQTSEASSPAIDEAEVKMKAAGIDLGTILKVVDAMIEAKSHGHQHAPIEKGKKIVKRVVSADLKKKAEEHAKKIYDIIYPAMHKAAVTGYGRYLTAATDKINSFSKSFAIVKIDLVESVLRAMDAETKNMMFDMLHAAQSTKEAIVKAEMDRLGADIPQETIDSLYADLDNRYTKIAEDASGNISETAKERVRGRLEAALQDNQSTSQLTNTVKDLFEGTDTDKGNWPWARTIARTESLKYANTTRFASIAGLGFQKKIWYHSGNDHPREGHLEMDGQIKDMDEPFINPETGENLMIPGDPGAGPEETCSCGCTWSEYVEDVLSPERIAELEAENE